MIDLLTSRDLTFIDTYTRIHLKRARSVYHFDFAEDGLGDKQKKKGMDTFWFGFQIGRTLIYNFKDNNSLYFLLFREDNLSW